MKRWEYKVTTRGDEPSLNAFGKNGWELVAVVPMYSSGEDTSSRHYFRRPIGKIGACGPVKVTVEVANGA